MKLKVLEELEWERKTIKSPGTADGNEFAGRVASLALEKSLNSFK